MLSGESAAEKEEKEGYLRDSGKIEDYPANDDGTKTTQDDEPTDLDDGHVREWEDRARVILDMKEELNAPASPNQSPAVGENIQEDVEEKSKNLKSGERETPY